MRVGPSLVPGSTWGESGPSVVPGSAWEHLG